ncbi:MAG: RdgB/HAM1 family non-canonical purine NTP pyrophosphatase [Bacteroidales bacterium]|nr:RdgB/HAM1 family non-canonical purine NTP pyrophosphatase [Bacteroidales bacterium]
MTMELIFATNNIHKLTEAKNILGEKLKILSLEEMNFFEEIPEDYLTLEENARQKSKIIYERFKINCFSDDTGLEVESLNNEPGVFSARYAGENKNSLDNIKKLLENLENKKSRKAQFRTIIALIFNNEEYLFEGIIKGKIAKEIKGMNGFGYDSVFIPENFNHTFAELSDSQKNTISHRALALEQLFLFLNKK